MFILADLIALRNVGIKITLAVELCEVSTRAADRFADAQDMPHRFSIDYWQGARVRETDGTHVHVRPRLVGIVRRAAEHLGPGLELGVYFKANGWPVMHSQRLPFLEDFRERI